MKFEDSQLPDTPLYRKAFDAGYASSMAATYPAEQARYFTRDVLEASFINVFLSKAEAIVEMGIPKNLEETAVVIVLSSLDIPVPHCSEDQSRKYSEILWHTALDITTERASPEDMKKVFDVATPEERLMAQLSLACSLQSDVHRTPAVAIKKGKPDSLREEASSVKKLAADPINAAYTLISKGEFPQVDAYLAKQNEILESMINFKPEPMTVKQIFRNIFKAGPR